MSAVPALEIQCNGALVFFEKDSFDAGTLRLVPDTLGEQCEDCGADILNAAVRCGEILCRCGMRYSVRDANLT